MGSLEDDGADPSEDEATPLVSVAGLATAEQSQQMTRKTTATVGRKKNDFMAGFLMVAETSCIYSKEVRGTRHPIAAPRIQMASPICENMQPRF